MHIEIPDAPFPTCGWVIHEPAPTDDQPRWCLEVRLPECVRDDRWPGRAMYGRRYFNHREDAIDFANRSDMLLQMVCDYVICLQHYSEKLKRELSLVDPTGKKFRALLTLDSIRDDILTVGWPLGDDSDQEATPRRLVQELLDVVHQHRLIPGKP